jgi:transposase
MVHVHGARAQQLSARTRGVPLDKLVAVPIDVGKSTAVAMACDFTGQVLVAPLEFTLDLRGVAELAARVDARLPAATQLVRVGVEAAGHYHRPLLADGVLPTGWQVVELNPAWVTAQRRANGSRGVKTDRVDLAAITDLVLAGRGYPVRAPVDAVVELAAWVAHRRRRVLVRTATKNQLTGQVDRCFPGLGACLSSVCDTKVGRLVITEFCDPARLARLGVARFRTFAARRDIRVSTTVATRLVDAARQALPTAEAAVARQVLAADLALLGDLDAQIAAVDASITAILPSTRYQVLTTVPGWGPLRAGGYGAAVGDPDRWPSARQIYRAAGLTPSQYESAGKRRDGGISREGSVELRRALLDLGVGLWHCEPAGRAYASRLRERGKPGGIIATAIARIAGRLAYAMVRDQTTYEPGHRS